MVISQKIYENIIGNRGSKSVTSPIPKGDKGGLVPLKGKAPEGTSLFLNKTVKEQRVDGSYVGRPMLRCTLMSLEISYQVKILSNHINSNKKYFSTLTTLQPVNINA